MSSTPPECRRCRHYFVTYEPSWPHGCRWFEIKTRGLPSAQVRASSGEECQAFENRVRPGERPPPRRN